jgi:hypothetical protein
LGGNPRWMDLALDNETLGTWLLDSKAPSGTQYRINPQHEEDSHPTPFLEHWSCYTNDGNRALIRDLLLNDAMTVQAFRANGAPDGVDSFMYGKFNGETVPVVPQTFAGRGQMLAADVQVSM